MLMYDIIYENKSETKDQFNELRKFIDQLLGEQSAGRSVVTLLVDYLLHCT